MKHLLTGVAMAAALAIAAPAWAQNPPSPAPMAAPAKPMTKPMAAKPMMKKPMHHMAMRHHMMHHHMMHHRMSSGDQMTEDLNRQELARITGGGAPMAAPMGSSMTPGGNNPTSGSAGPFAPSMSAPPPAK